MLLVPVPLVLELCGEGRVHIFFRPLTFEEMEAAVIDRRTFNAGLVASGVTLSAQSRVFAQNENVPAVTRIAFGSCSKPDRPQTIWNTIADTKPDLFVALGDIVYADKNQARKIGLERALDNAFNKMASNEAFNQFRSRISVAATWDDNDYGPSDSGGDYPDKENSRKRFLDFWSAPQNDPRRTQAGGIYTSLELGPSGRQVQVILLDTRFKRSPLKRRSEAERRALRPSNIGPYLPYDNRDARLLGTEQWEWLENQFRKPVLMRIICSSIPFIASYRGWENWSNFPREKKRMLDLIASKSVGSVLFISGDSHYGEISLDEKNGPYALWDVTSSGLTHHWPTPGPNEFRLHGQSVHTENFGLLHIVWQAQTPLLVLELRNANGGIAVQQVIYLRTLEGDIQVQPKGRKLQKN